MIEIYFNDLKEEAQKLLLEEAGIKDPSDANWDVSPIATLDFEDRLRESCEEILDMIVDAKTPNELREKLENLLENEEISQNQYDYICEWWDDLTENHFKVSHERCAEILNEWVWGDDVDDIIEQLRSLNTEGEITDGEYDYILENWDDLLEEKNKKGE